jgi:DegV family protein with EDD domain
MGVRIATDSTCDLPEPITAALGIAVVPCYINIGGQSLLDGVELSRKDFYARLPGLSHPPTTSAPGITMFVKAYERLASEGATDVVSIHISGTLSNVVNVARLAAEVVKSPSVAVLDAGQLTLGTGLLVLKAAEAAADGASASTIKALVEAAALRTHSFAVLDTLEYLRRSGRVSRLAAGLGTLLSVKPLLKMSNGLIQMERVRTRQGAIERMLTLVRNLGLLEQLAVVHSDAPEAAAGLWRQAADLIPGVSAPITGEVTPVIGSHVGPGAVGLVCIAASKTHASTPDRVT